MQGEGVEEVLYEESGKVVGSEVRWRRGESDECVPLGDWEEEEASYQVGFPFFGWCDWVFWLI